MESNKILTNAKKFIDFLNANPTPFHVVDSVKALLREAGFTELKLSEVWKTKNLGKYFVTKNETTLVAFVVGGKYVHGNGFSIVGAHTDSPGLKLKLVSKKCKSGYLACATECYGGGIWHTWFDRDLTIAGRVLVKENEKINSRLVYIKRPILRIPNLAIHLNRETNEKFGPNKENHLVPILATSVKDQLLRNDSTGSNKTECKEKDGETRFIDKHHTLLIDLIARELNCKLDDIFDVEMQVVDSQPAVVGGALNEFIFGGRLDNQVGSYCSIQGLIDSSANSEELNDDEFIRMAAIYDHEECGSESATGAASALTEHIIRRLVDQSSFELAISKSFLISCDQAHAVHPNYSDMHEENHKPSMHGGPVIKYNGNQRYATNTVSASIIREAARMAQIPTQDFMVKNDSPCGSTIGPILSSKLGITTVDIGGPQLSMHSIREIGSTDSITQLTNLIASFYKNYGKLRAKFSSLL